MTDIRDMKIHIEVMKQDKHKLLANIINERFFKLPKVPVQDGKILE